MRRFAFLMFVAGGLLLSAGKVRAAEDREILFYLAPSGLMAFEIQITVEGRSLQEAWKRTLDERFQEIDKNQDCEIAGQERDLLPNTRLLRLMMPNPSGNMAAAPARMDQKAFGEYMEKLGFSPFKVNVQPVGNQNRNGRLVFIDGMQNDPAEAAKLLFEKLDADANGRLSQNEMARAQAALAKQDLDQDETISSAELVPVNYGRYFGIAGGMTQTTNNQMPFLRLEDRASYRQAATQLMTRYDTKEKDNALSLIEVGVSEKLFGEHDIDGNGKWDFEEVQQYLLSPTVNVIVQIQLGTKDKPAQTQIEFEHGEELESDVKNGIGSLNLGIAQLEVSAASNRIGNMKSLLESQFKSLDRDGNGYLDKEEAQRAPNGNTYFQELDKDRDEKLFFEEVSAGVLSFAQLMTNQIHLNVADRGRDLFRILDTDSDNRLSVREFRAMPRRAALWDKDGDGEVALADVPQQYGLTAERGGINLLGRVSVSVAPRPSGMPSQPARSNAGPPWFQKMDRNADGDVSLREFLGTAEQFEKLDQDKDGLISPQEAESA